MKATTNHAAAVPVVMSPREGRGAKKRSTGLPADVVRQPGGGLAATPPTPLCYDTDPEHIARCPNSAHK